MGVVHAEGRNWGAGDSRTSGLGGCVMTVAWVWLCVCVFMCVCACGDWPEWYGGIDCGAPYGGAAVGGTWGGWRPLWVKAMMAWLPRAMAAWRDW